MFKENICHFTYLTAVPLQVKSGPFWNDVPAQYFLAYVDGYRQQMNDLST